MSSLFGCSLISIRYKQNVIKYIPQSLDMETENDVIFQEQKTPFPDADFQVPCSWQIYSDQTSRRLGIPSTWLWTVREYPPECTAY